MLRLELRDSDDTVLFLNPLDGVCVRKVNESLSKERVNGLRIEFAAGSCEHINVIAWYGDIEHLNAAYEYVLSKINEYLFPQIDEVHL